MSTTINCSGCGAITPAVDPVGVCACPDCGSSAIKLFHYLVATDTVRIAESIKLAVKDPARSSGEKMRRYTKAGDDYWRSGQKWVRRELSIDRDNNRYLEKVIDPESGAIIHECDESLMDHRGHGSDKEPGPVHDGESHDDCEK